MTAPTAPAPGYYTDPLDPSGERWWDGSVWTETVRPTVPASSAEAVPALEPDGESAAVESMVVPAVEPDCPVQEPVAAQVPLQPTEVVTPTVPPGLYPDPYGQAALRWWDGHQWTTRTSQPVPEQAAAVSANPAYVPGAAGGSTVLPTGPQVGTHRTAAPGRRSVPGGIPLPNRAALTDLSGRFGRKWLIGVLVLALAAGVRLYFAFDGGSSNEPAPASIAAAVNLRPGDLPRGWTIPSSTAASGGDTGTTADTFQRDVERCSGAPDPTTSLTYTGASPTWTHGTAQLSSGVAVLRTPALAQQDLRAQQGAKGLSCVSKVGTPALKRLFAAKGITLTGLSASRLPGAAADGFAFRMKMTLSAHGRTLIVWNDAYGFVRGKVEVSLTHVSTGSAPDRVVAAQALQKLRARATSAVPGSH